MPKAIGFGRSVIRGAVVLLCLAIPLRAADFMKMVTKTDSVTMMGQTQPARVDTATYWFTDSHAYMESLEGKVILAIDDELMYFIDDAAQAYMEISIEEIKDFAQEADRMLKELALDTTRQGYMEMLMEEKPEAAEQLKALLELAAASEGTVSKVNASVTKTEETLQIGDWNTRKYIVEFDLIMMGSAVIDMWVTDEIKLDYDLYQKMSNSTLAVIPGFQKIWEEMGKVEGVGVRSVSVMSIMGTNVNSVTQLLEYEEKEPPDGIFDIPEGYKKLDMPYSMGR